MRRVRHALGKRLASGQWLAMWIFLGAIVVVALLGAFERARPLVNGRPLSMVLAIQMFMLLAGALIIALTRTDLDRSPRTKRCRAGTVAVIAVFGIAWPTRCSRRTCPGSTRRSPAS